MSAPTGAGPSGGAPLGAPPGEAVGEPATPVGEVAGNGSVIHDIGYQRYTGARLGRGHAVRSLLIYSLRAAFGLGRGGKAKIFPWAVSGLALMVAAVAVAVRAQIGEPAITYLDYPETVQMLVLIFLAVVAPELVSRDLRAGVLPLYFARPLRRTDYALIKWAALTTATFLMLAVPELLLFLGGAFGTKTGMSGVWHELGDLLPGLAYSGLQAVLLSSIAVLMASLTGRRAVASGIVAVAFLVTTPVMGVFYSIGGQTQRELAGLVSPLTILQGVRAWLLDPAGTARLDIGPYGALYASVAFGLALLCLTGLLERYRRVSQ